MGICVSLPDDIVWTGPLPGLAERGARSGLTAVAAYDQVEAVLATMDGDRLSDEALQSLGYLGGDDN